MAEQPEARHLVEMLRRHYQPDNRPPAGVFAPEIGSPDGKRRADAVWMPTTVAGGTGLHGHEVKVSRSDVLVELADPTKADAWAQYCSRWWLVVVSPALVNGLEIPEAWGVMAPPSGRRTRSMTIVKPAPKLTPRDAAPGLARLAAWQLHQYDGKLRQIEHDRQHFEREADRLRRELDTMRAVGSVAPSKQAEGVARILRAVEERLRDEGVWRLDELAETAVVGALVDHVATAVAADQVRRELDQLIREVKRVVEPFRYSADRLAKAEKLAADLAQGGGPS